MIPEKLNTLKFNEAWKMFLDHRKEIKRPLKPTGIKLMLKKLAENEPDIAAAMLEQSIENGWQGIFPLKCIPMCADPETIWQLWRKARQSVGLESPARTPEDLPTFRSLASECRSESDYYAVFKAYCEDEEKMLIERFHPIGWIVTRMNKYMSAIVKARVARESQAE